MWISPLRGLKGTDKGIAMVVSQTRITLASTASLKALESLKGGRVKE